MGTNAKLALILGVISIVLLIVFPPLAIVCAVISIVLGTLNLKTDRKPSIIAIIISSVAILIPVVFVILIYLSFFNY